ncbi:MRGX1 protein, partial [Eubucco bourcierii]|nr:MRGX1 protein [Eubucco bourcierii]
ETITTDLSLSNLPSAYVDYGEYLRHICFVPLELKAIAAVCMAISLCGLVGNGLVLWLLGCHMKQNPSTTYILYLAIADFCMLLLFLLLMLAVLSFSLFCLHDLILSYSKVILAIDILCQYFQLISLAFLTAVSVEQCLAVF